MPRSRRTLLKSAGLAVSSGMLASVAGCLGGLSSDGGSGPAERSTTDPSTTGQPTTELSAKTPSSDFVQWLPDPTKTSLRDGYGFLYFDVAGISERRESMHENAYSRLEREMLRPIPGDYVDVADVDTSITLDFVAELSLGSFDPETVGEKLASDGESPATTSRGAATTTRNSTTTRTTRSDRERYRGFDLYGTNRVYAVSEDALLLMSPMIEGDSVDNAKAIIDAATTETSHYADGNEYVSSMLGVVDNPHALWCYPEAMDGLTSRGFRKDEITGELKSWRFGSETTYLTFADTYPDEETAKSGELANYIESQSRRFGSYDGLDVEIDGLMAWADGTTPTNEFDHLSAGDPSDGVHTTYN